MRIFVKSTSGGLQRELDRVEVIARSGLLGDRFFGRHAEPGQSISLIEAEEIETFLTEQQRPLDMSVTSRNIVTRGVHLPDLIGQEFMIGEVRLRGVDFCEPCVVLGQALATPGLTPAAVVKRFTHRAGIRADVLSTGLISTGASIRTVSQSHGSSEPNETPLRA